MGKAAGSKFEIPGSIPSAANFFLFFSQSSAFAEGERCLPQMRSKKAPHFV